MQQPQNDNARQQSTEKIPQRAKGAEPFQSRNGKDFCCCSTMQDNRYD